MGSAEACKTTTNVEDNRQICEQMGWLVNEWMNEWTDTSLQEIMDGKDTNMGIWAASQTIFLQVNDG